tara:strand:+ start:52 stop:723 length:672 start_codon:yes stop_codon:yes gene_type:complete
MKLKEHFSVKKINSFECKEWFLKKHYAKRIPQLVSCFGLYDKNNLLEGVLSFGLPASRSLVKGAFKGKYQDNFLELNRLCVNDNLGKNVLSFFVSQSIKLLQKPKVLVSYADTSQGHTGYIYQATNWIYTGLSDTHKEWRIYGSNIHSKNVCKQFTLQERIKNPDKFYFVERPRKHRYFYLNGNRNQKKDMKNNLAYDILLYPKGNNKRYDASYKPSIQGILF